MRSRRTHGSKCGGGCFARLRGIVARLFLIIAVVCLLAFALWQTIPPDVSLAPAKTPVTETETGSEGEMSCPIDWDALPESIVTWVEVPGTTIDEPIAQATPDYPNRYLYEDALAQGAYGTPYIDWECTAHSPFVMVYGHNLSDGTVFADFAKFSDRDYARQHEVIYVHTRSNGGCYELKVRAVDVVDARQEMLHTSFATDEERVAYVEGAVARSDLALDGSVIANEVVWAFATCSDQTGNYRTVVYASTSQPA
ncbi:MULTISPECIES: class B sortase [unclassified Adlercreutzia]|uniref:class B sortase n=1 Tax=unclassified Adlercreutzia TaxID=2636013 RepID=UPI0013EB490F|nr:MULTISPECIES: class B sortase [unclassified Adlercreutzia]